MIYNFFLYFSLFCLTSSFLTPVHLPPISTFIAEFLCFASIVLFIPTLIAYKQKIKIPKIAIYILVLIFIPLVQYFSGQIIFRSNLILSIIYILTFGIVIIFGFNLTQENEKNRALNYISYVFLVAGILSSIIAIIQWLDIPYDSALIMQFQGIRPYGNFAQPNQCSTFLWMAIFACWYLYETNNINKYFLLISAMLFIFAAVLTQSRTGWCIAVFSFIFLFINQSKYNYRLTKKAISWLVVYMVVSIICLPFLNIVLTQYFNIIQITSAVDRVSTGYLRFAIWNQILHAILEKPWFGYGWYQTSIAQAAVIDRYPGQEWVISSHNFVLDILVWCGIPIGLIVIGLFLYMFLSLFKTSTKNVRQSTIFLMISAVVIHAWFEFPLFYAYFLFPVGFLYGLSLNKELIPTCCFSSKYLWVLFLVGLFGLGAIFKDYTRINDNNSVAHLHALGGQKNEFTPPNPQQFFDNFAARANWIALYPKMKVSPAQLEQAKVMAQLYITPSDLQKYATLLAYNGKEKEARRQLYILEIMYNKKINYDQLFVSNK